MTMNKKLVSIAMIGALATTAACTTDPYTGQKSINKAAIGTLGGAVGGYVLGDLIGGKNDRTAKILGAGIGAVAGAGASVVAGAAGSGAASVVTSGPTGTAGSATAGGVSREGTGAAGAATASMGTAEEAASVASGCSCCYVRNEGRLGVSEGSGHLDSGWFFRGFGTKGTAN